MSAINEMVALGETVQDYFDGMHLGDTRRLRKSFHADAYLFGYYHGDFTRVSLEEWITEVEGMDKPVETGEVFDMCIVAIDVTGPAAQIKVAELYAGVRYIVYLSLVRIGDKWKIVNKLYQSE